MKTPPIHLRSILNATPEKTVDDIRVAYYQAGAGLANLVEALKRNPKLANELKSAHGALAAFNQLSTLGNVL